jgi:hypothetical protein
MKMLLLLAVLTITACAKPQFVSGHPSDPNLPQKLGLSQQERNKIQSEFQRGESPEKRTPSSGRVAGRRVSSRFTVSL